MLIDEYISKRAHRRHVFARLRNHSVESPHFALESLVDRARMRVLVELPVQRRGGFDRVCVEVAGNVPVLPRDVLAIDEPPFDPQFSEKKQRVLVVGLVPADEVEVVEDRLCPRQMCRVDRHTPAPAGPAVDEVVQGHRCQQIELAVLQPPSARQFVHRVRQLLHALGSEVVEVFARMQEVRHQPAERVAQKRYVAGRSIEMLVDAAVDRMTVDEARALPA